MAELKSCPFCGGEGSVFVDDYGKYFTGCNKCNFYYGIEIEHGCELKHGWVAIHNTPEEAIEAWNTRKPMEAVVAELEKYAKSKICDNHKHGCPYKDNEDIYCENCGALGAISIVRGKE